MPKACEDKKDSAALQAAVWRIRVWPSRHMNIKMIWLMIYKGQRWVIIKRCQGQRRIVAQYCVGQRWVIVKHGPGKRRIVAQYCVGQRWVIVKHGPGKRRIVAQYCLGQRWVTNSVVGLINWTKIYWTNTVPRPYGRLQANTKF